MTQPVLDTSAKSTQRALRAMRNMLFVTSFFAVSAAGIAIWLYSTTIPKIKMQKEIVEEQKQEISETKNRLAEFCIDLATRENSLEHKTKDAIDTLDKCMLYFPHDETLPAYKGEILASRFALDRKSVVDIKDSLDASAMSLKIKPSAYAYETQALSYCLKSKYGAVSERDDAVKAAIASFQKSFLLNPSRKSSISRMARFQEYCPMEVQQSLQHE